MKRRLIFDISRRRYKLLAIAAVYALFFELGAPFHQALAQSSGSGQTSSTGGIPGGNMVDLFTGDFNYNIPLMNVDGFPITLTYDANVTMNQEASWVGLGWSLNPGAINREMRGLPDDFNGQDKVSKTLSVKSDISFGQNVGVGAFVAASIGVGDPNSAASLGSVIATAEAKGGLFANTYSGRGFNFETYIGAGFTMNPSVYGVSAYSAGANVGGGLSINSRKGVGFNKQISEQWSVGPQFMGAFVGKDLKISQGTSNTTRGSRTRYLSYGSGTGMGLASTSDMGVADISFGSRTFTPYLRNNATFSSDFERLALGAFVTQAWGTVGGYVLQEDYSDDQRIVQQFSDLPAIGYQYLDAKQNYSEALLDFNRENETAVADEIPATHVSNLTYDLFRISGATGGYSFRGHRNDVGTVHNDQNRIDGTSDNSNFEANGGAIITGFANGGNISFTTGSGNGKVNGMSGGWLNSLGTENLDFVNIDDQSIDAETHYFKVIGERIPNDFDFEGQYGGTDPARVQLEIVGGNVKSANNLEVDQGNPLLSNQPIPTQNYQVKKENRNTVIAELTAQEASHCGYEPTITTYSAFNGIDYTPQLLERVTSVKKGHHLSEFIVYKSGGQRCVYNIPVYSLKEKEVTFNVSNGAESQPGNTVRLTGLIPHNSDDASDLNTLGRDKLFHEQETPGFAHSYLLRSILSDDYDDRTGDGLTPDDYGSYLQFNYTQVYGETSPFKWRTPYAENGLESAFSEQKKSYSEDNIGRYSYGEKEMWYVHSIEGKNYIAEFFISDREDVHSVLGENGGIDISKPAQKLDKIILYNKADRLANGNSAEPIQTVHFEYDYSLCQFYPGNDSGIPSEQGKLTLKKIFTVFSDSRKGEMSPYIFEYNGSNEDYNAAAVDRWGVYKPNNTTLLPNYDFPYASQDKVERDAAVATWALTDIILPSGGKIVVDYESDDYGFTQDRKAMDFYRFRSFGFRDEPFPTSPIDEFKESKKKHYDRIYLDLEEPLPGATLTEREDYFLENYFKDITEKYGNQVYYHALISTKEGSANQEILKGFFQAEGAGVIQSGTEFIPYINIAWDYVDDEGGYLVNPIMKDGWQFLRNEVSREIFPDGIGGSAGIDVATIFSGLNKALNNKGFCPRLDLAQSFVRLTNPDGRKLGGNHRVKEIRYFDNWSEISTNSGNPEAEFDYGVVYDYNDASIPGTDPGVGVAGFEPTMGNDINPWRQPIFYTLKRDKFPDDFLYQTTPLGESHFGSPVIGYSKVVSKNIDRGVDADGSGKLETNELTVKRNRTGFTVSEFFTCKDFPTEIDHTPLQKLIIESNDDPKDVAEGLPQLDKLGLSQGFVIEKNDMHGKSRRVQVYGGSQEEDNSYQISKVEYHYAGFEELQKTILADGTQEDHVLARDIDLVNDVMHTRVKSFNSNTVDNLSFTFLLTSSTPPIPLFIPLFSTNTTSLVREQEYVLNSFTKTIHNYAVLDRVETTHLGATVTQANLAYDNRSGAVLASSTQNEYNKEIYSLNYPARWAHPGMDQAVLTYNNHFENVPFVDGWGDFSGSATNLEQYLETGDEVLYTTAENACFRAWVLDIDETTDRAFLVFEDGTPIVDGGYDLRVVRSGHRNHQYASMASVATLVNPLTGVLDQPTEILGASAMDFDHIWASNCDATPGTVVNPYTSGLFGNWRGKNSFVYQTDRAETSTGTPVDLRDGGTFDAYVPYYALVGGEWKPITDPLHPNYNLGDTEKWLNTGEITAYDKNGNAVEMRDVINRNAGVLYGYNNDSRTVPIAMGDNAKHTDLAYDGFEDYSYLPTASTSQGHFDFKDVVTGQVTQEDAHSGRFSLKLQPGEQLISRRNRTAFTVCAANPIGPNGYVLQSCDCLTDFNPDAGKYVFSVWVKEQDGTTIPETFTAPEARVAVGPGSPGDPPTFYDIILEDKEIIDGWRRLEGSFTVDAFSSYVEVQLENTGSTAVTYFDDVRMHPFNSAMNTSVYDPLSLRKWADLDAYNYATFYEYNEQGLMVRMKQETRDGIKTITETRSSTNKTKL